VGLPAFELLAPGSVEEAIRLLTKEGAVPLAGGTAIVPLLRQRLFTPSRLVSLHRLLALAEISPSDGGGLSIGAMASLRTIETHPLVRARYPLLAETLGQVANVRVRGGATLGGNLAHGDYRLDPPAALIALDARLRLGSARGVRALPVKDFFLGFFETAKQADEILLGVDLPAPAPRASSHYLKFTTHASADWPCVGVAVQLRWEASGKCEGGRVILTAAAPTPLDVQGVGEALRGTTVPEAAARKAGELAAEQIEPLGDAAGSAWYKREITPALVRRALLEAARRAPRRAG